MQLIHKSSLLSLCVPCFAFSGSLDKTVRLWDLKAGMPLSVSKSHGGTVRCLAVDSTMLVSGSSDHSLRIWMAAQPQIEESYPYLAPTQHSARRSQTFSGFSHHSGDADHSQSRAQGLHQGVNGRENISPSGVAGNHGSYICRGSDTNKLLFDVTAPGMVGLLCGWWCWRKLLCSLGEAQGLF